MESIIFAHLALCAGSALFVSAVIFFDRLQERRTGK